MAKKKKEIIPFKRQLDLFNERCSLELLEGHHATVALSREGEKISLSFSQQLMKLFLESSITYFKLEAAFDNASAFNLVAVYGKRPKHRKMPSVKGQIALQLKDGGYGHMEIRTSDLHRMEEHGFMYITGVDKNLHLGLITKGKVLGVLGKGCKTEVAVDFDWPSKVCRIAINYPYTSYVSRALYGMAKTGRKLTLVKDAV